MKRAVKLSRREMKRKIKKLEADLKRLQQPNCYIIRATERTIIPLVCHKKIDFEWVSDSEEFERFVKEDAARQIGADLLKMNLFEIEKQNGPLGKELILRLDVITPRKEIEENG